MRVLQICVGLALHSGALRTGSTNIALKLCGVFGFDIQTT